MEVLNTLLDLPQMTITAVESNDNEVHIHLVYTTERRRCSQCGQESTELHQNHPRIVRDLPISGKTCYLHFTKRRFFCSHCRRPFSERLDFVDPYRDYTRRYQDYVYRLVRENNISYVERIEGLSYEVAERIFVLEAKARLPSHPFKDVVRLGLDEIAERKGRGSYDLIFYNLDTGAPLDVLEGRTKKQLLTYLEALPEATKARIEEVCIDMWRPYAQAVRLALPEARLVVDRFHVMKAVNEDLKRLKNKEKKALPKAAQSCHYALLKNEEALTEQQQTTLAAVYAASPRLKQAHQLKEAFRAIFEQNYTISKARRRLKAWIKRAYKADLFPTILTSLKHWLRPILNYFAQRTTNAASEGVNNKIKLIKRRAYGFRNFGNFRLRILAAF